MFRFHQVELDEELYELRRAGVVQAIEPKVLDVLLYLVRHRNRLVTKTELLERVWPDVVVAESALTRAVSLARSAIGDTAQAQRLIETVSGRGYRFRAPVEVVQPSAAAAADETVRPPARSLFVGRSRELVELRGGLDQSRAGHGQFFLIDGEPGIGKTRLAEEIAHEAARLGMAIAWGRCWEAGGAPTFWPWSQALRTLLNGAPDADMAALGNDCAAQVALIVPEIGERYPGLETPPPAAAVASESARFRLFEAVGRMIAAAAAHRPTLLVFDDLHSADPPTLLLLGFLVRDVLREARILVLGTYRSHEMRRSPESDAVLAQVAREGHHLPLGGLSEAEVAEFIAQRVGQPTDCEIARTVHRATDGNPLFVDEVVRVLLAAGGSQGREMPIPSGVRQAVGRRMQGLSEACRRMLAVAAVIGRDFDLATLDAASADAGEVGTLLDEALATGVVTATPATPGRYAFSHAIAREAIYAELSGGDRAQTHRRVGETIEALGAHSRHHRLSELAHHFFVAAPQGNAAKAIEYSRLAGDRAVAILAFEDAAIHYGRALQVLALAPHEGQRCQLLIALGDAENRAGAFDEARAHFREAAEIARRIGAASDFAAAAIGYGGSGIRAGRVDPELVAVLEEALRHLGSEGGGVRAYVLARLAIGLYWSPDRARSQSIAREAVETARRCDDRISLAEALVSMHWSLWTPEHVEQRLALAEEIVRLGEELHAPEYVVNGRRYRIVAWLELGDVARADLDIHALAEQSKQFGVALHIWYAPVLRAGRALMDGRFEAAPALIEEAFAVGRKANNPDMLLFYGVQMFALLRDLGRLTELEAGVVAVVEGNPALPAWRGALAYLWAESGQESRARAELDRLAADDFACLPRDVNWLPGIALLAEASARIGDVGHAERLYALLLPFETRNIIVGTGAASNGPASYFLGILASTMAKPELAVRHLEAALAMARRMGARPAEARAALALSEALRANGESAGSARLAEQAAESARDLGMRLVEERARALCRRLAERT